jgi:hypothetical protein
MNVRDSAQVREKYGLSVLKPGDLVARIRAEESSNSRWGVSILSGYDALPPGIARPGKIAF